MLAAAFTILALTLQDAPAEPVPPAPEVAGEIEAPTPAPKPDALMSEAGRYVAFHRVVADLGATEIDSADDIDDAMDRLTAFYAEDRLVRAWIAYAAIIAAQHPEYLDEVRDLADYYGPEAAASGLMYDPAFATSFTYAPEAQGSVVESLERDTEQIRLVSERFRTAAYDLQSERWAQRRATDRQDRLEALRTAGEREESLDAATLSVVQSRREALQPASALFEDAPAVSEAPLLTIDVGAQTLDPDRQRVGRILSVAALQAISDDPTNPGPAIEALMNDPAVERCLAWVRLDLEQCVAAGAFKYEDSFCIAEHALLDVSRCLGAALAPSN
jgi:hypothetical protein